MRNCKTKNDPIFTKISCDLKTKNLIFKTNKLNSDIDIIISHKDYKKLNISSNFILLNDRIKCDKHIFYLYLFKNIVYLLDFNIDGLLKPGYYRFDLDIIKKNVVFENGVYFLSDKFYQKYKTAKKENRFQLKFLADYLKLQLFKYKKLNLNKINIVFVGLDGSGKSTSIKNFRNKIEILNPKIQYMGWKEFKNPIIKFYRNIKYSKREGDYNLAESDDIELKSILKILVYYSELYLRYILNFLNLKTKIIIYDRYFYDWLINVESNLVRNFFKFITPRSHIIFFLTAPIEIMHKRKKEISIKNLEILNKKYLSLLSTFKNVYIIDTNNNEEEVVDLLCQKFFKSQYEIHKIEK